MIDYLIFVESSSQEKYRSSSSISNGKCDSTKQKDVNLSSSHPQCKQAGRRRTSSSSEVAARKTLVHVSDVQQVDFKS